jgi:hypothetical protein
VLNDTNGERDWKVLSEMNEILASESCILFTSRSQCSLEGHHVYPVSFLESETAMQLFRGYAFETTQTPPDSLRDSQVPLFESVRGCHSHLRSPETSEGQESQSLRADFTCHG